MNGIKRIVLLLPTLLTLGMGCSSGGTEQANSHQAQFTQKEEYWRIDLNQHAAYIALIEPIASEQYYERTDMENVYQEILAYTEQEGIPDLYQYYLDYTDTMIEYIRENEPDDMIADPMISGLKMEKANVATFMDIKSAVDRQQAEYPELSREDCIQNVVVSGPGDIDNAIRDLGSVLIILQRRFPSANSP